MSSGACVTQVSYSVVAYIAACGKTMDLPFDAQLIAIELFCKTTECSRTDLQLTLLGCVNLAAKLFQRYPRESELLAKLVPDARLLSQLNHMEHKLLVATEFRVHSLQDKQTYRWWLCHLLAAIDSLLSATGRTVLASAVEATALFVFVFPRTRQLTEPRLLAFVAVHVAASFSRKEKLKLCPLVRALLLAAGVSEEFFHHTLYPVGREFVHFIIA